MESKTVCVYHHKDLDGKASAAIVKLKYPEAIFIGWDYGDPLPKIEENNDIIMVDICLEEKSNKVDKFGPMLELAEKSSSFIWIDHHHTSIKKYEESTDERKHLIQPYCEVGKAACELTWEYFFTEPIPRMITLLGEYDTWRVEDTIRWEKVVMPFQFGMRVGHTSVDDVLNLLKDEIRKCPHCGARDDRNIVWINSGKFEEDEDWHYQCDYCDSVWTEYPTSHNIENIVHDGKVIISYQGRQNTNLMKYASYEVEFDGLRAIVANSNLFNSQIFNGFYNESKHDIMLCWHFNGKLFKYSLYTTKDEINVGDIAAKHGGGGHKGAAGFENEKYIL